MIDKPVLCNIGLTDFRFCATMVHDLVITVAGFLISIPFAGNIAAPNRSHSMWFDPSRPRGSFRHDSLCDIISARSLSPFHSSKRERY